MKEIEKQKLDAFLAELAALTKAHGLAIGGCGCCGSPFVYDVNDGTVLMEEVKEQKYAVSDQQDSLTWK